MSDGLISTEWRDAVLILILNFDQMLEMSAAMQALAHLTDDHMEGVA